MGDDITHRSVHVAAIAIEAALEHKEFTAGALHDILTKEMENPPSKKTVQKILRQLREDDLLEKGPRSQTSASRHLKDYRRGNFVSDEEVNVEEVSKEIEKEVTRNLEQRIRNVVDKKRTHRKSARSGNWTVEKEE